MKIRRIGYALGAAGFALLGMAVGGEPGPAGPVAIIAVDTVACAMGAYAGAHGRVAATDANARSGAPHS